MALATALGLALALLGTLVCRALRVVLPAHRARRALQVLAGAATISGLAAFLLAVPTRSAWVRAVRSDVASALPLFTPVTRLLAARPESSYASAFLQLGLMGGLALALLWLIERRGFDRVLTAPPQLQKKSAARMDANRVEWVLLRREQRVILFWVMAAAGLALSIYFSARFLHPDQASSPMHTAVMVLPYLVAEFAFITVWTNSSAQASRDLRARPLLASLPLTPAMTLAPKEAALRWAVLPVLSWLVPPLVATHGDPRS